MGSVNKRREIREKRERKRRVIEVLLLIVSVLFLGGMLSVVLRVETVDFPNPMLKQAVRAKLGPGIITKTSVSKIRKMDMSNGGHEDLVGIESLWNMRRLNLSCNYVSDLTPLSGLQYITELDLSYNNVYCLEGLESLVNLEKLNLEGNIVRDLTPLKDLPNLIELNLNYNSITSLEDVNIGAMAGSPLRILRLRDNYRIEEDGNIIHLSDVSGVQGLRDLWRLDLRFNQVQDISPIAKLDSLGMLDMRENGLSDISELAKIGTLRKLNLRGNELRDINPLRDLKNLTYLNLHSNIEIETIEPISGLVEMDTLIVCNIPIGEEFSYVSGMSKLRRINFRNCGIKNPQFLIDLMAEGTLQDGEKKKDRAEIDLQYNDLEYRDLAQYKQLRDYWDNVSLKVPFALPRPMNDLTVTLSHPSGFYEEEFDLVITCNDPNARILYTLDGSEPDVDNIGGGKPYYVNYYKPRSWKPSEMFAPPLQERRNVTYEYMGPIHIKDRTGGPNDLSEIITSYARDNFTNILKWSEPSVSTPKFTVIKTVAFESNSYSESNVGSYSAGSDFKHDLPIVNIIVDPKALFDFKWGIYVPGRSFFEGGGTSKIPRSVGSNYRNKGKYWGRDISIEFIDKELDNYLSENVLVKIQGGWSRMHPQKGLKIFSQQDDGCFNTINSEIFLEDSHKKLSSLKLRKGGSIRNFILDVALQEVVTTMEIGTQRCRPAIEFINGEYWGITNLRDRYDVDFLSHEFDFDPQSICLVKEPRRIHFGDARNKSNTIEVHWDYIKLNNYIQSNDLTEEEIYNKLCEKININSFIDYNLAFLYLGNWDWHGIWHHSMWKNNKITNHDKGDKWKYLVWDFDAGFGDTEIDLFEKKVQVNFIEGYNFQSNKLFARLCDNRSFREKFVERSLMHLDTTFDPMRICNIIDEKYEAISSELYRHKNRWGRSAIRKKDVQNMKRFARKRPAIFLNHLKKYFPEQF